MSRALGRYELLRPLARGGMAEVFLARRRAAGVEKWLVVKRIRPERSGDVRFLDLFVREARLSMSLAHQNIVPVFDFGRIDDQVFLAMERVEGKDLGSTLARAGDRHRLPPLVAAFIAAECCQALDYAHHRRGPDGAPLGIVHRDVTPRNVLLSWSGEVKLTDFGIAALAGDPTSKLLGTPAYMAPEQARGEPVDARADVYAIGMVLRELLTGERARPGTDRDAILASARANALAPWRAEVPPELVAIVDCATASVVEDRFSTARAMLAELDGYIVSERAARKSEAPARLLASWLDDVWSGEREDRGVDGASDGDHRGDHLVSFLDDGALDVVGTGTARSLAATAADEPAPAPTPTQTPTPTPSSPAASSSGASSSATSSSQASSSAASPRRSRVGLAVVAGLAGAAVIAVVRVLMPTPAEPSRAATTPADAAISTTTFGATVVTTTFDAALAPVDAATVVAAPADAAIATTSLVDAAVVALAPVDAAVAVAPSDARVRPRPDRPDRPATPSDAGPRVDAAPRTLTINAKPWAYFTVNGDPTQHETPKSLQLPPGRYRVQFTNPVLKIERTVTIDVPPDRDVKHIETLAP